MSSLHSSQSAGLQSAIMQQHDVVPLVAVPSMALPFDTLPVSTTPSGTQPVVVEYVVHRGVPQTPSAAPTMASSIVTPQRRSRTGRTRPLHIFVDRVEKTNTRARSTKQSKLSGRIALAERSDSANSTPTPSPRNDAESSLQSPNDTHWTGKENQDPNRPNSPEPFVAAFPHNPAAYHGPPPPPSPRARINRPNPSFSLPPPQNIVLYEILGFDHWRVSKTDILSAWRHMSLQSHPDRAPQELRDLATAMMQQINAAKDVLTDRAARRRYHQTGRLPIFMVPA